TLAGPAGWAVGGLIGAALGSIVGAADEASGDQSTYDLIRAKLTKDSSALVLLADAPKVDELLAETRKDAREVVERDVRDELKGRLEEALIEAARQPVASPKVEPQPSVH